MLVNQYSKYNVLDPTLCRINDFIYKGQEKYFDIWFDTQVGRHYEQYKVYRFSKDDLDIYEERKNKNINWVSIQYVSIRDEAGYSHLRVFTQRVLFRLNQIKNLQIRQGTFIIKQIIRGFKEIFKRFSGIQISERMICITERGQVKVWMNEEYSRNEKNKQISNYTEQLMIERIFELVESKIHPSLKLQKYKSLKQQYLKQPSFDSAQRFIQVVNHELQIPAISELNIDDLILNNLSNSPKLNFERKITFRNSNRHLIQNTKISKKNSQLKKTNPQFDIFRKAKSVRYFNILQSEIRLRSKSNFSQDLNLVSKINKSDSSFSYGLKSPKKIKNIDFSPINTTTNTLKMSSSTNSEVKNQSYYTNSSRLQSPSRKPTKLSQYFQFCDKPLKTLRSARYIKQSVINHQKTQQKPFRQDIFRGLRFWNRIDDLKKSQFIEQQKTTRHPLSPPPVLTVYSSMLFKSIIPINIKQIEENIDQEFD